MSRSSHLCRRLCNSINLQRQQVALAFNFEPTRLFSSNTDDDSSTNKQGASSSTSRQPSSNSSSPKKPSVQGRQKSWDAANPPRRDDQRRTHDDQHQQSSSSPRRPQGRMTSSFPASSKFIKLLKQSRNTSEEEIIAALSKPDSKSTPATEEDYLVFAEIIEAYLSCVKKPNPSVDGMDATHHATLHAILGIIRDAYGTGGRESVMPEGLKVKSPLETRVVNMAPKGRLPWEILGVDESRAAVHWAVDLTEGKAKNPWQNALLSNDTKNAMYELHKKDSDEYSVENLAKIFKIRQQRVMAILALKEIEENYQWESKEEEERAEEYRRYMEEEVFPCFESKGADEKHIVNLPSYPAYATLDAEATLKKLEEVMGKPSAEISPDEITPEISRQVLGVKSVEELEQEIAEREEDMLVREFKERLDYNLGRTGKTLFRKKGKYHAPKRPEEGWSLVVTPLGEKKEGHYVAMPDGSRRELSEDEMLLIKKKTPLPRRKIE